MSEKMPNNSEILMVSYFFPPLGGAGSIRPLKLAKYLPEYGWNPVILTVKNPDWYYADDPGLQEELSEGIPIYRTKMLKAAWIYRILNPLRARAIDKWIRRYVFHPDQQSGWIPTAYAKGIQITKERLIKAIYSSSAPISCHLIAYIIKKKTGLPWIADFRDEWYENPDIDLPTVFHRKLHYRIERKITNYADYIITAAPGFCRLLSKHKGCNLKCSTIYMGYDPKDYKYYDKNALSSGESNKKFTIVFSGLFYAAFRPDGVLEAISNLIDLGKIPSNNICLKFVGANSPDELRFKDRYRICEFTGFLPHREAVKHVTSSDVLLLLLSRERGEFVVPSKTFEYIASGKPILAAVPEQSEVASIIRASGSGEVVDFSSINNIMEAITMIYKRWSNGEQWPEPRMKAANFFNQKVQTRKFSEILNQISFSHNSKEGYE